MRGFNSWMLSNIYSKTPYPTYTDLLIPDESWRSLINNPTPGFSDIQVSALSTLNPTPGTIITLAEGDHTLVFNEGINGWRGTRENPIWVIGHKNGTTVLNKAIEVYDCRWVYLTNINNGATVGTSHWDIQNSLDCMWNWIYCDDAEQNNIRVWGTPSSETPSSRIRMYNIVSKNAGVDALTYHANGSGDDIGNFFILVNALFENGADSNLDITSGGNFHIRNIRSIGSETSIGHGVKNIYIDGHISEEIADKAISFKNTDGQIILANFSGEGEVDFGIQNNPRASEEPNSRLTVINGSDTYETYQATLYNVNLSIDNNTGVIIEEVNENPIDQIRILGFQS